jgi:glutamate 5-kinase
MTTNQTEEQIKEVLDKTSRKDINININNTIDDLVDFPDVSIVNENSYLP